MNTDSQLEEHLSDPPAAVVESLARVEGDLVILGVSGKMGPTLARMAVRAAKQAAVNRLIIGVSRFSSPDTRAALEQVGVTTIAADLTDPGAVRALPEAPNVILMVGQKFGTRGAEADTWATNVLAPAHIAEQYAGSRIVALSTGNVYPFSSIRGPGPTETDPTGPVGEYAQSALGRERILTHLSGRNRTPMTFLRLNYANECRYGILRDLADLIMAGTPVDLAMGHVNLIWQRDANAIVLRALETTTSPPTVFNLTGLEVLSIRKLALALGDRLGVPPTFQGTESPTALLSDARRMADRFGPPETPIDLMIDQVAGWVARGGTSLEKPTHYGSREGVF